jgi:O-antigen/teichoic acid export membrane protein
MLTLATTVCIGLYILFVPLFFSIFFPQYLESIPYSALYALTIAAAGGSVASSALLSQRRTKDLYILNIGTPLLSLALQLIGVIYFGLWGLVIGKTLSTLLTSAAAVIVLLLSRPAEVQPR